jgi:hypothetical protein
MKVASIDKRDVDRETGEVQCRLKATETADDDDHAVAILWRAGVGGASVKVGIHRHVRLSGLISDRHP